MEVAEFLKSIAPPREHIDRFIEKVPPGKYSRNQGWTFDGELGWILADAIRQKGVDGTRTLNTYEPDGARRCVNAADKPCRIHSYGNSFTHGDQVSDGETWQEYLAAHLCEPIRNYGVGGYSVYQAYRRMRAVEAKRPASHIVLNIYDDDHYRSLDAWWPIRFGPNGPCSFTRPYLRVNVREQSFEERENPIPRAQDVYKLLDPDWVHETFKDDPTLHAVLATRGSRELSPEEIENVAVSFGLPPGEGAGAERAAQAHRLHLEAALYSTRCVLELTERFANETGRNLFVIFSYGRKNMTDFLSGVPRFDQPLFDWLKTRDYPVVDMRDSFQADFETFKGDVASFILRYYIGHHNPLGNFFTAWALREKMYEWLEPKPLPVGEGTGDSD